MASAASSLPDAATIAALGRQALAQVLDVLQLRQRDPLVFEAGSLVQPQGRIYGGQVLAQALLAAGRTVRPSRLPHSLHGYFLRPGDFNVPVELAVEELHDGNSFSARRTHAIQHGRPILSMIASFQEDQPSAEFSSAFPSADIPEPESLPSAVELMGELDNPFAKAWSIHAPFDYRHVDPALYLIPPHQPRDQQLVWVRARGPVPNEQILHRALLAFSCDQLMLEPVLRRHGVSWTTPRLSIASLDHAIWWHRDVQVDEWLLFTQSSPSAQGGRGLGAVRVFAQDGTLVASIAQEGMVRVPQQP